jgi:hypothetical protein
MISLEKPQIKQIIDKTGMYASLLSQGSMLLFPGEIYYVDSISKVDEDHIITLIGTQSPSPQFMFSLPAISFKN